MIIQTIFRGDELLEKGNHQLNRNTSGQSSVAATKPAYSAAVGNISVPTPTSRSTPPNDHKRPAATSWQTSDSEDCTAPPLQTYPHY